MKRTYRVEIYPFSGEKYIFEVESDNIEKTLTEYCRVQNVRSYKILQEETTVPKKQMIYG